MSQPASYGPHGHCSPAAALATLALNIAGPIAAGAYGRAAFDSVGPILLIGWAEIGPGLLLYSYGGSNRAASARVSEPATPVVASGQPSERGWTGTGRESDADDQI